MTNATTGLHRALGRAATAAAEAIADMKPDDLLAHMSDDQKAAMSAHFTPAAAKGGDGADGNGGAPAEDDDGADDQGSPAAAACDPRAKVLAKAVATTDACKGKADAALNLLADDDFASLSASALIKMVAAAPASSNPEDAARAEMRAALSEGRNSNIDADAGKGAGNGKTAEAAGIWDRATARVFPEARK